MLQKITKVYKVIENKKFKIYNAWMTNNSKIITKIWGY